MKRPLPAALVVACLALASSGPAFAQSALNSLGGGDDSGKPVNIEADQGIEWQQEHHVYIARGNVKATRGQSTLYCDTLYAYYRPSGSKDAQTAAGGSAAGGSASGGSSAGGSGLLGDSSSEIYRLEADGNVRLATETQTIYGDHAIDDVDQGVLVVTGKHLKLVTPNDVVTARDSLEWYDRRQLAVARGDAVAVRIARANATAAPTTKTIRADVLTALVERGANQQSHISHINASGHVIVSSLDQIATGDRGVYDVDSGIATLIDHVSLTKGDNEMRGRYAVVDLNKNVGHLLSAPPNEMVAGAKRPRVEGLLVPHGQQGAAAAAPGAAKPASQAPAKTPAPAKTQ